MIKNCYCGSISPFEMCCEPLIKGVEKAVTAEGLMRSRYSAFATHAVAYLVVTTHKAERSSTLKEEILLWATSNRWQKLELIKITATTVEFKAYFFDCNMKLQLHHELSTFVKEDGLWYYVDGIFL